MQRHQGGWRETNPLHGGKEWIRETCCDSNAGKGSGGPHDDLCEENDEASQMGMNHDARHANVSEGAGGISQMGKPMPDAPQTWNKENDATSQVGKHDDHHDHVAGRTRTKNDDAQDGAIDDRRHPFHSADDPREKEGTPVLGLTSWLPTTCGR